MNSCKSKDHINNNSCFSCCEVKQSVQDKLCCEFNATAVNNATIFSSDANQCANLVTSGTIKNCDSINSLEVRFFSAGNLVRFIIIPPGGCFSFTLTRLNVIIANSGTAGAIVPGEICITTRINI